jgi:hypothetical protein
LQQRERRAGRPISDARKASTSARVIVETSRVGPNRGMTLFAMKPSTVLCQPSDHSVLALGRVLGSREEELDRARDGHARVGPHPLEFAGRKPRASRRIVSATCGLSDGVTAARGRVLRPDVRGVRSTVEAGSTTGTAHRWLSM